MENKRLKDLYDNIYNSDIEDSNGLTEEQTLIINSTDKRIMIDARAGSGKTYTMGEYMKGRPDKNILYTTYSKAMITEATRTFTDLYHVTFKTLHSLAYKDIGYRYKHKLTSDINIFTVANGIGFFAKTPDDFEFVETIKAYFELFVASPHKSIEDFCRCYDIRKYLKPLNKLFKSSKDIKSKIKITHDFYLKLWCLSEPDLTEYDMIVLDEVQDFKGSFVDIVKNSDIDTIIAVGDTWQNIYGFSNTTNIFEEDGFDNWTKYNLTKSFRFGNTLAKVVRDMTGLEVTGYNKNQKVIRIIDESNPHMILCRYNATILNKALENSVQGKKIYVEGKVMNSTISTLEKIIDFKFNNKKHMMFKRFGDYDHFILTITKHKEYSSLKAVELVDKYGKLLAMNLNKLKKNIVNDIKKADVSFSTAHSSKGFSIEVPMKLAEDFKSLDKIKEDNDQSEFNLLYVALTRCKGDIEIPEDILRSYLETPSYYNEIKDNSTVHAELELRSVLLNAYKERNEGGFSDIQDEVIDRKIKILEEQSLNSENILIDPSTGISYNVGDLPQIKIQAFIEQTMLLIDSHMDKMLDMEIFEAELLVDESSEYEIIRTNMEYINKASVKNKLYL